eukprot:g36903.t1
METEEVGEVLNEYFALVFMKEREMDEMKIVNIKREELLGVLKTIKVHKSPEPDGIFPRRVGKGGDYWGLTEIFVSSLATGKIPEAWRIANVLSLFKKVNKDNPGNYRLMIFMKTGGGQISIYIIGAEVDRVESVKFLGATITDNLSWTSHVDAMAKKGQQRLFFLRWLRKSGMFIRTLANFYRCTTESIQTWYSNCFAQDHKKLQKVVCTAQTI